MFNVNELIHFLFNLYHTFYLFNPYFIIFLKDYFE